MNNELISIVMPTYNCAQFIMQSIESVLKQSYTNWELLIVDDCSTDNTESLIRELLQKDGRIHYTRLDINSGAAVARNTAIKQAKGHYVAFLDADDLWMPNKLECQLRFMQENKYAFTYTNYLQENVQQSICSLRVSGPKHISPYLMLIYGWVSCPSVMLDRQVVGTICGPNIRKRNDYALWLKVIKKADCYLLDADLLVVRKHRGSISAVNPFVLLGYFYKLWRVCENKSCVVALWRTTLNVFGGIYKHFVYSRKIR